MLVLSRKRDESVVIDHGSIVITVVEIRGDKVRLGISAHPQVTIHRSEVEDSIAKEQKAAGEPPLRPRFYPGAEQ